MITSTRFRMLRSAAVCVVLATRVVASTFVIDDDGGPGVDFTNIPAAIAAASPGDVLLVRPGSYGSFTLTKGLSILGESGASITVFTVSGVPEGQVALISRFQALSTIQPSRVLSCAGTVIVQDVSEGKYEVIDSSDVRFERVTPRAVVRFPVTFPSPWEGAALHARNSRVEVVQSTMLGADFGADEDFAIPGAPGVYATGPGLAAGALVHLARTSSTGGRGGFASGISAAAGGAGVLVGSNAPSEVGCEVVIAGGHTATIRGGMGGDSFGGCERTSLGGPAIAVRDPRVRYSDVTLAGGIGCFGLGPEIATDDPSFVDSPSFADPTLGVSGSATAGGSVVLEIRAEPRSKAFLFFGRQPVVQPDGLAQIERLVDVVRARKLGLVPLSGQLDQGWPIPANAEVGDLFVFQAAVQLPSGEYRRTNSVPVVVR